MRRHTARLVLVGSACGVAAAAIGLRLGGEAEGLHLATRYTARAAFLLFLLPFLASTLHATFRSQATATMVRERRGLGLAFATAHFIHLGFIVTYITSTGTPLGLTAVTIGAPAYAGLVTMTLTSTDRAVRALGPARWRRLHTAAIWYIWLVFLLTYLRQAMSHRGYLVGASVLVLAAALRLSRGFLARRAQAAVS